MVKNGVKWVNEVNGGVRHPAVLIFLRIAFDGFSDILEEKEVCRYG